MTNTQLSNLSNLTQPSTPKEKVCLLTHDGYGEIIMVEKDGKYQLPSFPVKDSYEKAARALAVTLDINPMEYSFFCFKKIYYPKKNLNYYMYIYVDKLKDTLDTKNSEYEEWEYLKALEAEDLLEGQRLLLDVAQKFPLETYVKICQKVRTRTFQTLEGYHEMFIQTIQEQLYNFINADIPTHLLERYLKTLIAIQEV